MLRRARNCTPLVRPRPRPRRLLPLPLLLLLPLALALALPLPIHEDLLRHPGRAQPLPVARLRHGETRALTQEQSGWQRQDK
jgi:hypothetical protein